MLRNYITVAWRSIVRNKLHTGINVAGLAVGMATCILIMLWVKAELGFDRFHQDGDRIFRLCHELTLGGGTRDIATGSALPARRTCSRASCPADSSSWSESHGRLSAGRDSCWRMNRAAIFIPNRETKSWRSSVS